MNKQKVFSELSIKKADKQFVMTKLWHSVQKKYRRIFKKQESLYNDEKIENTHSDNESDKTNNERKQPYKGRKANSSRSNDKSISTNYDKRDNSLDIVRNDEDNYEVVLPYQRIIKKMI